MKKIFCFCLQSDSTETHSSTSSDTIHYLWSFYYCLCTAHTARLETNLLWTNLHLQPWLYLNQLSLRVSKELHRFLLRFSHSKTFNLLLSKNIQEGHSLCHAFFKVNVLTWKDNSKHHSLSRDIAGLSLQSTNQKITVFQILGCHRFGATCCISLLKCSTAPAVSF